MLVESAVQPRVALMVESVAQPRVAVLVAELAALVVHLKLTPRLTPRSCRDQNSESTAPVVRAR
jgi:hypothetical protein